MSSAARKVELPTGSAESKADSNAALKGGYHAHAISKELLGHIVGVITGCGTDAAGAFSESIAEMALEALVGDVQTLANAQVNKDNDAAVDANENDLSEHLYVIARRAKSALWLAQFAQEVRAADARGKPSRPFAGTEAAK